MSTPGQCIAVVSGKGGTGKTSFVAGVGAALSLVLMVLIFVCVGIMNHFADSDDEESMVTL